MKNPIKGFMYYYDRKNIYIVSITKGDLWWVVSCMCVYVCMYVYDVCVYLCMMYVCVHYISS